MAYTPFDWSVGSTVNDTRLDYIEQGIYGAHVTADAATTRLNRDKTVNVLAYGAALDGTTDDTTAIQNAINAAFAAATPRRVLIPGPAAISAPLIIPPFVSLEGDYPGARTDSPAAPSRIKALASFTGSGMIKMVDQTTGGYSTQSYGQRIRNLTLDGTAAKGLTTFSGIRSEGLVRGVIIENVGIYQVSDRGLQTATANSATAYSWDIINVQVGSAGLDGFRLSGLTDTTVMRCRAIGCGRHGWYVDGMANSTFTGCRAEWSSQHGWYISTGWGTGTGSGGATWSNCSTDRNNFDGFNVDATGNASLMFSNIMCRRDGRNGNSGLGGYAGFRGNGATMPISIDNLFVYPGVDDDGTGTNSPQYGVRAGSCTSFVVNSGYVHAASTATNDLTLNGHYVIGANVYTATGTTASPTRT